jgi:hypothetical protein
VGWGVAPAHGLKGLALAEKVHYEYSEFANRSFAEIETTKTKGKEMLCHNNTKVVSRPVVNA